VRLSFGLVALVLFQGALGMWTVTLGLFPTVVMGHLLGGFATLSLLFLLLLRVTRPLSGTHHRSTGITAYLIGLIILTIQIALGGWTSANYAATVCTGFPICQGDWLQHLNVNDAFQFWGHGLNNYEFGLHLTPDAKITIHAAHRIGAMITSVYLTALALRSLLVDKTAHQRILSVALLVTLLLQIGLGISNVVLQLPLAVAVAHNGVAALLLLILVALSYFAYNRFPYGNAAARISTP